MSEKRNLILADSQEITNAGIKYITGNIEGIDNILETRKKSELIKLLSENTRSIIILDYTVFDFTSLEEVVFLYEKYPESSWILFSDELTDTFLRQILAFDPPFSIIYKYNTLAEIETVIKKSLVYEYSLGKNIENHLRLLKSTSLSVSEYNLTATETEILKEIALGRTTKEIAFIRNISFHTVLTHRKNIFRKLEVNNVHEASKYAMRAGIVDPSDYYI